ncbi:MAG: hypothetical protein EHM65_09680, partial [Acidobacteriales bacterium]
MSGRSLASLVQSRIDRIRADHRSGAVALTHRAGDVLCLLAREQARSEREFRKRLAKVCRALVESQPSMAPILNLAKFVLVGTDEIFDLAELKTGVKSSVRNFLERMEVDGQATSNTAANLIQDGMTVMTHSASQTVMSALLRAAVLGRRVR